MPKALEKVPETLIELEGFLPELVAQAREEGKKSVDVEVVKKDAASKEKERILGLVETVLGEEVGKKMKTVIESGVTTEQFKAIENITPKGSATGDEKFKTEMLEAIKKAGAANVGSDGGDGGQKKDYMTMVEEYQRDHKCTKLEAMQAITAKHPDVHKEYIKKANEGGK
jgi:hypothetical protein